MKSFYIFILLIMIYLFYSCKGTTEPTIYDTEKIIPLNLLNEWVFENINTGNEIKMKVSNRSSIASQDYFKIVNSDFIFNYEKLFYRNDSLFTFNRDSNEVLLIGNKSNHSTSVFQGRYMFVEEEIVEVPAGTFECYRIRQSVRVGFSSMTTTIWFAYGIGPVMKSIHYVYHNQPNKLKIYHLKSFDIK